MTDRPTRDDPPIPRPGTRLTGEALGIDIGGTGVKAALVDLSSGELVTDRIREKTPHPSTPDAVADTVRSVVDRVLAQRPLPEGGAVGCGLPGVIKDGRLKTAANIDASWIDVSAEELLGERLGRTVLAINDADAAGIAEMTYGAGLGLDGTILILTIGTGIGSALFIDGRLVPNTEFGHVEFKGKDAETRLSGTARERRGLGWKRWAKEFNAYLSRLELYFSPDLIVFGGGVSKAFAKWNALLESNAPRVPAHFLNAAGIIGAAYAAASARAEEASAATARKPQGRGRRAPSAGTRSRRARPTVVQVEAG
jgi:polyphosphate glucokinase